MAPTPRVLVCERNGNQPGHRPTIADAGPWGKLTGMAERGLTLAKAHQLQREVQAVREHLQQLDAGVAAAKVTLRSLEVRLQRAREPAPWKPEESSS